MWRLSDGGWPRAVLCLFAAAWIWLFLLPMERFGLLVNARGFLPILLALAVIHWLPWRWLRAVAALVLSYVAVAVYFAPGMPWAGRLAWVWSHERRQAVALLQDHALSDPLQTHLFILGLCAMYWLVAYAIRRTRLWVFYNLLGVGVLGLIDANTPVHPDGVMVGVLALFLISLGVAQFMRLNHRAHGAGPRPARFFVPLAAVLAVSLAAGWGLPKRGPVWANPLAPAGGGTGGGVRVIGYQVDNSHLGGSFVMDHTPVLAVVTDYPAYLRGQVYDLYTGKGWIAGQQQVSTYSYGQQVASGTVEASVLPGKAVRQTVTVLAPHLNAGVLFGAYVPSILWSVNGQNWGTVMVDPRQGTFFVRPLHQGDVYTLESYELQAPGPKLAGIPLPAPDGNDSRLPQSVLADLEVPASLPQRVRDLARQVTSGSSGEYDAVQRVAAYLQANYQYATDGIPVPGPNQDYVDQFLFETKKGYCNNFSTAMAVMLRTIGVPARWVTGFTEGSVDPAYGGPGQRYTVENADAHSWVEVYFPGVGWVPFDPTPNFSMPYLPAQSNPSAGSTDEGNTTQPVQPPKPPQDPSDVSGGNTQGPGGGLGPWLWRGLAALVAIAAAGGVLFRRRLRSWWHHRAWRGEPVQAMWAGLQRLMGLLRKNGDIPQGAATLRDLKRAARVYGIPEAEYRHLVRTAESAFYGDAAVPPEEAEQVRRTWSRWLEAALRWPGKR